MWDAPPEHHIEFQYLTHRSEQVECPLRNAQDSRMVYDMLWSDPAVADPVPCLLNDGRFNLFVLRVLWHFWLCTALQYC